MDPHALAAFAAVTFLGGAVGWTELAGRYRDRPTGPLRTLAGWTYIGVNAFAAAVALAVVRNAHFLADTGLPKDLAQVLLAGIGAMAFFRSAVFTVRVRDEDVPLGPAIVLQVILNASDRAYDRLRAAERSRAVTRIMTDVSFERAKYALPAKCIQLMQNVSTVEQQELRTVVDNLDKQIMGPRSKSENLGLLLMNLVGEKTLEIAVQDSRPVIGLPNAADDELLKASRDFVLGDAARLVALCRFLDPDRDEVSVRKLETEARGILEDANRSDDVKITALVAALRGLYGSPVVLAAFARLGSTSRT